MFVLSVLSPTLPLLLYPRAFLHHLLRSCHTWPHSANQHTCSPAPCILQLAPAAYIQQLFDWPKLVPGHCRNLTLNSFAESAEFTLVNLNNVSTLVVQCYSNILKPHKNRHRKYLRLFFSRGTCLHQSLVYFQHCSTPFHILHSTQMKWVSTLRRAFTYALPPPFMRAIYSLATGAKEQLSANQPICLTPVVQGQPLLWIRRGIKGSPLFSPDDDQTGDDTNRGGGVWEICERAIGKGGAGQRFSLSPRAPLVHAGRFGALTCPLWTLSFPARCVLACLHPARLHN